MKILIVEDHYKINSLLARFLRQDEHEPVQAYNAEEALESLKKDKFDMVITDLMLPDMQGEELIRKIREVNDLYIMVNSAKTEISDRVDVINLGADDYLTKPFSVEEVLAKLKHIAKRIKGSSSILYSYYNNKLIVDPIEHLVKLDNQTVNLTAYEYNILYYLIKHHSRIFSLEEIINTLFSESEAYDRVVDVYIKNIRKKLNDDPKNPKYIRTIFGVGYQFVGERDD